MMKISLSCKTKEEIEKKHWEWFKNDILKNLITYLKKDQKFKEIFFEDEDFLEWFDKKRGESDIKWFNRYKDDDEKFKVFKNIILANAIELKNYKCKFDDKKYSKKFKKYFEMIYEKFRTSSKEGVNWSAEMLVEKVGVNVCPYCNRSYIDTYVLDEQTNKLKFNGQLDHFYPKEKYPFLALSLYNIIPVCSKCNHIKGNNELNIDNPYLDTKSLFQSETVFTIDLYRDGEKEYDLNVLYGLSDNFNIKLVDISINKSREDEINNLNEILHIETIYNLHKRCVQEIIKKSIIYSDSRINEIYNQYKELFKNKQEVQQLVLGNPIDEDTICKQSLGKLTRDIWKNIKNDDI